ncbi:MAG: AMP-binding protein [Clostridiales bacterium]|nr:AMP-binding protein [Clostridiales bacterium]
MSEKKYWNMEMELLLNTPQMREIQLKKLQKMIAVLYETKPYWHDRLEKAGIRPGTIQSLEEYSQKMPIMDKETRRILVEQTGSSLGMAELTMGAELDDIVLYAATSGTSGVPTPYPHSKRDIQIYSEQFGRMLWRIGVRPGDRVLHCFGLSMYMAGVPYVQFIQEVGCSVLPVGAEAGSERIAKFAKEFKPTVMFCTPSFAEHFIERYKSITGQDVKDLGIRIILCAGEPGAGIPEVREKIETAYGAKLYDHGGAMGVSCDCEEYQGMHHLADDNYYIELVDPDTFEPIPWEDGARGMMCSTSLEFDGMLWFRETFGDIWEISTKPCPCGCSGWRYKVVGRADDMLKVKGTMVYPAAIDGVVNSFVPRVTGEFRIVLDERPPRVVPPLKLKIEYGEGMTEADLPGLEEEMMKEMKGKLSITPKITWIPPYSLERSNIKTNFFERNY